MGKLEKSVLMLKNSILLHSWFTFTCKLISYRVTFFTKITWILPSN